MKKYRIRKSILKALDEYSGTPCNVEDVADYPAFMRLKPSMEDLKAEWDQLEKFGYIKPCEGFDGQYCRITEKGLKQLNPEFKKDSFVYGPHAAE
jgi:CTP-dependent riboflavin kinase